MKEIKKKNFEERYSKKSISDQLINLSQMDDQVTENLSDALLDGKIGDVNNFITEYESRRNRFWLRKLKANYILNGTV